jgi:hypothetical protein
MDFEEVLPPPPSLEETPKLKRQNGYDGFREKNIDIQKKKRQISRIVSLPPYGVLSQRKIIRLPYVLLDAESFILGWMISSILGLFLYPIFMIKMMVFINIYLVWWAYKNLR